MRKHHVVAAALITVAFGLAAGFLLLTKEVSGQQGKGKGPAPSSTVHPLVFLPLLPPVPQPPNIIALDPIEQLGKNIIFDNTLSDPPGYSCFQCHAPTTGGTSGLSSTVNLGAGPQPGVVPGRTGNRRPLTYTYALFSPTGPY